MLTEQRNILLNIAVREFTKKGFQVETFDTSEDSLNWLKGEIKTTDVIGFGGSKTLEQIGFFKNFTKTDYPNLLNRNAANLTFDDRVDMWRKALTADVFLCSANGVSVSGELILIDKNGNRNAAATFGPKKRIFIIGWNKLQRDFNAAMEYAKNVAAVQNNLRFQTDNPCTKAGKCLNCNTSDGLCFVTTAITHVVQTFPAILLIIKEDLGF
ncbi:MAG: lactate utilization protein [Spirochaetales bacterium]|nr:lactate utilization protein [Spirochaetales bacterium]